MADLLWLLEFFKTGKEIERPWPLSKEQIRHHPRLSSDRNKTQHLTWSAKLYCRLVGIMNQRELFKSRELVCFRLSQNLYSPRCMQSRLHPWEAQLRLEGWGLGVGRSGLFRVGSVRIREAVRTCSWIHLVGVEKGVLANAVAQPHVAPRELRRRGKGQRPDF